MPKEPMNDFDALAVDIITMVFNCGGYKVEDWLVAKVSARLQWGPQITIWPKDIVEANQRARDAARARQLPRPVALPMPTLPRPLSAPALPRPVAPLVTPGVLPPLTLPRVLP